MAKRRHAWLRNMQMKCTRGPAACLSNARACIPAMRHAPSKGCTHPWTKPRQTAATTCSLRRTQTAGRCRLAFRATLIVAGPSANSARQPGTPDTAARASPSRAELAGAPTVEPAWAPAPATRENNVAGETVTAVDAWLGLTHKAWGQHGSLVPAFLAPHATSAG